MVFRPSASLVAIIGFAGVIIVLAAPFAVSGLDYHAGTTHYIEERVKAFFNGRGKWTYRDGFGNVVYDTDDETWDHTEWIKEWPLIVSKLSIYGMLIALLGAVISIFGNWKIPRYLGGVINIGGSVVGIFGLNKFRDWGHWFIEVSLESTDWANYSFGFWGSWSIFLLMILITSVMMFWIWDVDEPQPRSRRRDREISREIDTIYHPPQVIVIPAPISDEPSDGLVSCNYCGNPNPANSNVCSNCGSILKEF